MKGKTMRTRKPKKKTKKEQVYDQEQAVARMVEDSLVVLNCSDLKQNSLKDVLIISTSFMSSIDEIVQSGLWPPSQSEQDSPWQNTMLLCGKSAGAKTQIVKSFVLDRPQVLNMKKWGLIGNDVDHVVKTIPYLVYESGLVKSKTALYRKYNTPTGYNELKSKHWSCGYMPIGDFIPVPTGKKKRIVKANGTCEEYCEDMIPEDSLHPALCFDTLALSRRVWRVSFSQPGLNNVIFGTNTSGVKGLFTVREKMAGESRRSALLHWVRDHLRRLPSKEEEYAMIKSYDRGKEEFEWFGLVGKVIPPDEDFREKILQAKHG